MQQKNKSIQFRILSQQLLPFSYDAGLTLVFALHGNCTVHLPQKQFTLHPMGFLIVNPFTLYRGDCPQNAGALLMQVSIEFLRLCGWDTSKQIMCYAQDDANNTLSGRLRALIANIFRVVVQNQKDSESRAAFFCLSLLSLLQENFPREERNLAEIKPDSIDHVIHVLDCIHTQWNEDLSIARIAEQEYLSPSYLSHLFTRHLHMTFTEYITSVRLTHAVNDLYDGTLSISEIAYRNGFKSTNAFISYFQRSYGETPGQFRKTLLQTPTIDSTLLFENDQSAWIENFLKFCDYEEITAVEKTQNNSRTIRAEVDTSRCKGAVCQNWRNILNIGYAHDGLIGEVQQQILQAQKDIGFTYLRFHGIFDDDMHIIKEQEENVLQFHFYNVDLLFDFILSAGLLPFVELGYMPFPLAKTRVRTTDRVTYRSMYCDSDRWRALVQAFLVHLIERYGIQQVRQWRFSSVSINYAYLPAYGEFTVAEYYEWYRTTYETIKEIDSGLCFGGPGGFASLLSEKQAIEAFLDYAQTADCLPDFFSIQCYPHQTVIEDEFFGGLIASHQTAPVVLSDDKSFTMNTLKQCRLLLERFGLQNIEIYVEEWNSTLWKRDLSGDTCYKAAWLVKNISENCTEPIALGYWLLSDYMEELADIKSVFHGGYGLLTYNGIPKAGYQALTLLGRLGEEKIASDSNWLLTKTGSTFQLLLYHYCHYDNLYRYRYHKLTDPQEAYKVFDDDGLLRLHLELNRLPKGVYRMEQYCISRSSGSSFDCWVEAGAPAYPNRIEMKYIADTAQPAYTVSEVVVDSKLIIDAELRPHEVRMIILHEKDRIF